MGRLKKPPAWPSAVPTTYSGTTALSLPYSRDIAVEPNGGRSLTAASALTTGLSGGGVIHAFTVVVWIPRGRSTDSAVVRGRTHPCPGGEHLRQSLVSAAEPATGRHSTRHIIHNIRSGGRLRHWLALAVAVVLHTHIHTTGRGPGTATSAPYVPGPLPPETSSESF